ncbi:helix-turn-helix domain-containing protein [Microbacter sp. GSS18]|nr:helix-turn-helix domain-containing protein [Microbacter sp. GSS18]
MDHPGIDEAEQAAAMLAAAGMARMPARVMMALVGSPDEGYTAAELSERLGVSPAAVSGAVRYLQSMQLIQRISRPGDRRDRYDLADGAFQGVSVGQAPMFTALAGLIDAIGSANPSAPASVARAHETADFLRFLAVRMPELVDEWRTQRTHE